jgi:hypothetical protein
MPNMRLHETTHFGLETHSRTMPRETRTIMAHRWREVCDGAGKSQWRTTEVTFCTHWDREGPELEQLSFLSGTDSGNPLESAGRKAAGLTPTCDGTG